MARVGLFSDEPVLIRGVESVLAGHASLELAVVSRSIDSLACDLLSANADVALIDGVPEMTLGVLSDLRKFVPKCRLILWVRSISVELACQVLERKVCGILRKDLAADVMVKCLLKVSQGETWIDRTLTASSFQARRVSLTPRESQLAALLAQGLKNKEIGAALAISEGTVKVYLSRLFQKVGAKDRLDLALFALKNLTPGELGVAAAPCERRSASVEIRRVHSVFFDSRGPGKGSWELDPRLENRKFS